MKKYLFQITTLLFIVIILISKNAYADAGIPMIVIGVPFMLLALVPVIIIEASIYKKELNIPTKKSVVGSLIANIVTTILGYPLSWVLHCALEFLIFIPIGILQEKFHIINTPKFLEIIMTILSITLGGAWLGPNVEPWMLTVAGMSALIPAFFVSFYVEKSILNRFFKDKTENEIRIAVWKANKITYQLLFIALLICLIYELATKISFHV